MLTSIFRDRFCHCLAIVAFGLITAPANAAPVTILNPSFETPLTNPDYGLTPNGTPIDGWDSTYTYETGQWNIGAFPYGCWTVPAPDGNQVAYAGYQFANQGISQTLSVNVQPNTLYTLTGYVGACLDPANPTGPSKYAVPQTISILGQGDDGDHVLNSTTFIPVAGHFQTFSLTFNSTGSADVGLPLKISFVCSTLQVAWDDIKLDASPAPVPVPGDFDQDGDVDGADYIVWQTHNPTASGATLATGDANGDGAVNGLDFAVWQSKFPTVPGAGITTVPEPLPLLTLAVGAGAMLCSRRMFDKTRKHA